jgi:hypothetical protein
MPCGSASVTPVVAQANTGDSLVASYSSCTSLVIAFMSNLSKESSSTALLLIFSVAPGSLLYLLGYPHSLAVDLSKESCALPLRYQCCLRNIDLSREFSHHTTPLVVVCVPYCSIIVPLHRRPVIGSYVQSP